MRRVPLAFTFLVAAASPALGQQSLKPEELQRIKSATVYVKVPTPRGLGSGSGFLVRVDGEVGYLVTNDHVIDPAEGGGSSDAVKKAAAVEVVFDSGGTKERSVKAAVVAADPDRDLAVLRVQNVKDLPKPLDLAEPKLFETMQVFVCGFPFGGRLADGNRNPEISIGAATVSSLRREVAGGQVSSIQLNGALNPGNSGGPVVAADGKLVGVAVKTVRGAGLGFAIPQQEVTTLLAGRVGRVMLLPAKPDGEGKGDSAANLEVTLLDPLGKIVSATAYTQPGGDPPPKMPATPGPIPGLKKLSLKIAEGKAVAEVSLPDGGKQGLTVQIELDRADGKFFTNAITVPLGPTRPGMIGGPNPTPDANGPKRTPEGKLLLASGVVLPFPTVPAKFPTPSGSESVSVVNADPNAFVGKAVRMDALSSVAVNPTGKNEFELLIETDSDNAPSNLRVLLPKDLALQLADLGVPELANAVLKIKFPIRVVGQVQKSAGRGESKLTFAAEAVEFLDDDGKAVTTFRPEATLQIGKPTLAAVNRFPEKFVGQTLTLDAFVKGARYSGGTGLDIVSINQAPQLNLDIYTSRRLAGQVDSDINKEDLPARARVTIEVKAIHGKTQKGIIGVKQIELLAPTGEVAMKVLKATDTIDYPNMPTPPKAALSETAKPVEPAKAEEKSATPPTRAGGDNTLLIALAAGAAALFLGGGYILYRAMRKPALEEPVADIPQPAPVRPKPAAKKPSPKPQPEAKADDNPFANFD